MSEKKDFKDKAKDLIKSVKDDSKKFDKKEMEDGKPMAVLAYLLPFIPYFAEKKNKYVRYHAVQGMNLLVASIAYSILRWILSSIYVAIKCGGGVAGRWCRQLAGGWYLPWYLNIPMIIIGIAITVLCVLGIVNVCQNKAKELPVINKLKIFKK